MKLGPMLLLTLLVPSACGSSPPIRYYTLVPPLSASSAPPSRPIDGVVDLLPVKVPAQADYQQMVVRQGTQRVELVESQQWIAPLGEEVRAALVARLSGRLPATPPGNDRPRLEVEILRFESALGQYALVEAQWQLRRDKGVPLSCFSRSVQKVGPGFEALVAGHQQAIGQLADDIALGIGSFSGNSPACPPA